MTVQPKHVCARQAPNLKLAITAGIGSDHVDLNAACEFGLTVAEITGAPQRPSTICRGESQAECWLTAVMVAVQKVLGCDETEAVVSKPIHFLQLRPRGVAHFGTHSMR